MTLWLICNKAVGDDKLPYLCTECSWHHTNYSKKGTCYSCHSTSYHLHHKCLYRYCKSNGSFITDQKRQDNNYMNDKMYRFRKTPRNIGQALNDEIHQALLLLLNETQWFTSAINITPLLLQYQYGDPFSWYWSGTKYTNISKSITTLAIICRKTWYQTYWYSWPLCSTEFFNQKYSVV